MYITKPPSDFGIQQANTLPGSSESSTISYPVSENKSDNRSKANKTGKGVSSDSHPNALLIYFAINLNCALLTGLVS